MSYETTRPKLSIVVPTYNQANLTSKCFESIKRNTITQSYELLWVDNGSAPDQLKLMRLALRRLQLNVRCIRFNNNKGFVKAANAGIREAQGAYLILMHNDTLVHLNWDINLTKPLENIDVGAVGPVTQRRLAWQGIANVGKRWQLKLPIFYSDSRAYANLLDQKFGDVYREIRDDHLDFFCVAFRRELFEEIGLLDEDFSISLAADAEFCLRILTGGMTCMLSVGTFAMHEHRATYRDLVGINIDRLLRKNLQILEVKKRRLYSQIPLS